MEKNKTIAYRDVVGVELGVGKSLGKLSKRLFAEPSREMVNS